MNAITLGDVSVLRTVEYEGTTRLPAEMFGDIPGEVWKAHRPWLAPDFWDVRTGLLRSCVQTWVLRSAGRTILIDTGVGNAKERPAMPAFHRLNTGYLARLAAAGVTPEDVDVVVNTHLHADHVGWNTRLVDGEWVPTFPNAHYLFPRADYDFWNPANHHARRMEEANRNVFEDSVEPVVRAGLATLWEDSFVIDENVTLAPAPGHTPGSCVVLLSSGQDRAVFVGDLLHNPVQVVEPQCNSCFCEDPAGARESRHRVLGEAADTGRIVFPAHLRGGRPGMRVERSGSRFAIRSWASLEATA
ncbi:MBL fold metallo-hydrolase [Streptomyces hygroscopicus]|uniref:MBL fold metallo-hydrolase n=1 Tax=Streptomyces hygroscopicus TaxID=1912 RepID=UPI001FCBB095|nr:MBL fold metallo-hydrolase [Streptomyces hygroscopicus]BDH13019.1 MBL fold metallo-hydrolase [Streptomyces hygroscopicus]